jgi:hypothetical protein
MGFSWIFEPLYYCLDPAVTPVKGIESPFDYFLLLYYNHWPVSKSRDCYTNLLLRKNIALSFEDIEYKKNYMPDLSGQSKRRYIAREAS